MHPWVTVGGVSRLDGWKDLEGVPVVCQENSLET